MTSIARRINMEYWLKQFSNFIVLDLVIIILAALVFFLWREGMVPEGDAVADRFFRGHTIQSLEYVISTDNGLTLAYRPALLIPMLKVPSIILLAVEGLMLIGELAGAG